MPFSRIRTVAELHVRVRARIAVTLWCALLAWLPSAGAFATPAPARESVHIAIERSADYLRKCVLTDGKFVYAIDMYTGQPTGPEYNLLRHAGTIYSMVMAYQYQPDESLKEAILNATDFLKQQALADVPGHPNMKAIWSHPALTYSGEALQAKLGGAGLGLVALLSVESIAPGTTSLEDLRAIGRFIMYMQKIDGGFYSKYFPEHGGRWDAWTSLYYPGEAALGLAMLHEVDPASDWTAIAVRALLFLARERRGLEEVPGDHWALIATARLLQHSPDAVSEAERELLIYHALQVCDTFLKEKEESEKQERYFGGIAMEGRTTPTATAVEGLVAILPYLPQADPRYAAARDIVDSSIGFLISAQIDSGPFLGGVPHATLNVPESALAFPHDDLYRAEIRIDYVQHALSAWVAYQSIANIFEGADL